MDKGVQITLIIVGAVIVLALLGMYAFSQYVPVTSNTVTVQGISQIKATPDLVTVYFSIETTSESAVDAKDKNAVISDAVVTNLLKLGFERKDIVTENFNVYPEYNWNNGIQDIKDYKASNNVKVEMSTSDTGKIGDTIDAGVNAGALISYINFELSQDKQNEYKAQALKQASEDARIKADSVASGLGKSVGKLVSVSVNSFDYSPWRLYDNSAMVTGATEAKTATTSIQPGSQDINAQVSAIFSLK